MGTTHFLVYKTTAKEIDFTYVDTACEIEIELLVSAELVSNLENKIKPLLEQVYIESVSVYDEGNDITVNLSKNEKDVLKKQCNRHFQKLFEYAAAELNNIEFKSPYNNTAVKVH